MFDGELRIVLATGPYSHRHPSPAHRLMGVYQALLSFSTDQLSGGEGQDWIAQA